MTINWSEWLGTIGLLVCCAAAVLLVKLLISNTMQQEKFFGALGKCYSELQTTSGRLESLCNVLDRRYASLEEAHRQTDPAILNGIQRFDKVAQEIRNKLDDLLLADPLENNRPFEQMSEPVLQEINKLQAHLEEMTGQLKRTNLMSMDENAELAAMRKRIESYQSMVMKARSEAKDSESMMAELRQEIQQLRLTPPTGRLDVADEEHQALKVKVDQLTEEKRKLEDQITALHHEKERNDIEKRFIEDRFIAMS